MYRCCIKVRDFTDKFNLSQHEVILMYDSRPDTLKHINRVKELLNCVKEELKFRAITHDVSKLSSPEKEVFDELTPLLRDSTYGSDEYFEFLNQMKVALDHHYSVSKHHPQHTDRGIRGMSLIDLIEMIVDWKASCERQLSANVMDSVEFNQGRFGFTDELKDIFINTLNELKMMDKKETKEQPTKQE